MDNENAPANLGEIAVENQSPIRVDDPEKARVMAEAGDKLRTGAAEARKQADDQDLYASMEEYKAGDMYSVQHPETENDGSPFSMTDRLEDPEKARVMAKAGDELRTSATKAREKATKDDAKADIEEGKTQDRYEILNPESISDDERSALANEAATWYKREQRQRYNSELRNAVGVIEAIKQDLIKAGGIRVFSTLVRDARASLNKDLQAKLREAVYHEAGIETPQDDQFEEYGETSSDNDKVPGQQLAIQRVVQYGKDGVTLTEDRFYRVRLGHIKTFAGNEIYAGDIHEYERAHPEMAHIFDVD